MLLSTKAAATSGCAAKPAPAPDRCAPLRHVARFMVENSALRRLRSLVLRACGRTHGGLPTMRSKPLAAATSANIVAKRKGSAAPSSRRCF